MVSIKHGPNNSSNLSIVARCVRALSAKLLKPSSTLDVGRSIFFLLRLLSANGDTGMSQRLKTALLFSLATGIRPAMNEQRQEGAVWKNRPTKKVIRSRFVRVILAQGPC